MKAPAQVGDRWLGSLPAHGRKFLRFAVPAPVKPRTLDLDETLESQVLWFPSASCSSAVRPCTNRDLGIDPALRTVRVGGPFPGLGVSDQNSRLQPAPAEAKPQAPSASRASVQLLDTRERSTVPRYLRFALNSPPSPSTMQPASAQPFPRQSDLPRPYNSRSALGQLGRLLCLDALRELGWLRP